MKYESYKDSGVEWIGKVPSHWVVAAFKRKITINNGKDYKDFLDEEIYPVMGSGGCFAYCSKYMFDGEALLLGRKGTIDKPLYINGKFWAVDTMFYATPHKDLNCKFAYYLALTFPFQLYSTSTALPSMTQTDLGNNPVAFPPIVEQQAIALYLDKKCEEIDRAIDTQKKKIELLNELKQTIITNAVTRGLNPDAPMKDSGAEWIGKIPKHWKLKRLKYISTIKGRIGFRGYTVADLVPEGEGAFVIGGKHINKCVLNTDSPDYISWDKYYESPEIMVAFGDIVMAQRGSLGKVAIIDKEIQEATINPSLVLLKEIKCNNKYLYNYLVSRATNTLIELLNTATAVPMISQNQIENMPIPLAPPTEQLDIVKYIDEQSSIIDAKISKTNRRIELLNELKQSIIIEAVTGKIKVC